MNTNPYPPFPRLPAALVIILAFSLNISAFAQPAVEPTPGALTNLMAQMAILHEETTARTPAQKKIYPSLLEALREHRGLAPRPRAPRIHSGLKLKAAGEVAVDINANVTPALLAEIQNLGGTVVNSFVQYHSIRAEIPIESMEAVASLPGVNTIRPAVIGDRNVGSATSEGDVAHRADFTRTNSGITGAGVKVGVLSDSSRFLTQSQQTFDLGAVTVMPGQSGVGTNGDEGEGTAMMEIIHDLAPGAQLYFATANPNEQTMAANITYLVTNYGCQIIVDDFTYQDESPFHENQPVSQALKAASDLGVTCFTSAGNDGDQDFGTSGTWQGDFKPSSVTLPNIPGTLHDWGNGSVFNLVTNKNTGSGYVALYWTDPWGGAASDYNVYVTDGAGNIIQHGDSAQAGGAFDLPYEITGAAANGQYIVVSRVSGPARMIQVTTHRGGLNISTANAIRGHNGSSAANVFGVAGVVAAGLTVPFNPTNDNYYTFSSDGPRRLFYESDGTVVTPGVLTSAGGRVIQQPQISAATGVTTSTTFATNSGLRPFYGTSASAPHAGAIAALLLSYRPDLTPAQIRAAMTNTTYDIGGTQYRRDLGAGITMADRALAYLNPTVTITSPPAGAVLSDSSAPALAGTANSKTSGLSVVRVALNRSSDAVWYDFTSGNWGTTTFDFNRNVLVATGLTSWTAQLPALANGSYSFQVESVDVHSHASGWTAQNFSVEAPAVVTFSPLTNGETVFDLSQVGGTINEAATMAFRIEQYDASGTNYSYWNGTTWIPNGNDPSVYLRATVTGNQWAPALGLALPARGQLSYGRFGSYLLRNIATNLANVVTTTEILVTRSPTDTTPPIVTLDHFQNGQIFTNPSLPALSGSALDNESGVASVLVYLNQFSPGGILYWNGTNWTANGVSLPITYNSQTVAWQVSAALPGGGNLPNGDYQVQVVVNNNESPADTATLTVPFSVDYHPIFNFTYGSQFYPTPNMKWENSLNWDTGTVPTPDAAVYIGAFNPDNTDLGSVQVYSLNISGGVLATFGMVVTKLNVSGGTLSGGAILLASNGVFNWSGGAIGGVYTIPANTTLNISGGADKYLSMASLENHGLVNWTGGTIYGSTQSVINNDATFVIQSSGALNNYTGGTPYPIFNNNGLLQKTISNGATTFTPDNGGWVFNQNGTIDVENGALSTQNQFFVNSGSIFSGAGETRVDGGTIVINGSNTIQAGGTVELAGGTWLGTNIFMGAGKFIWSGGTILSNLTLLSNIAFTVSGSADKVLGAYGQPVHLESDGPATWMDSGRVLEGLGSVFDNRGVFTAQNDSSFYNYTGGGDPVPLFINRGAFIKTGSANTTSFPPDNGGCAFDNYGSVTVQSGILALGGGGSDSGATFNVTSGSEIDLTAGAHNFGPNIGFTGPGPVRLLGGTLDLEGTMLLTNTGIFEIAGGMASGRAAFGGNGTFIWSGGAIQASLGLQTNVGFNIISDTNKILGAYGFPGMVTNSGPAVWTGAGLILCGLGSVMENDGPFTAQNDSTFQNYTGGGVPLPVFVNKGTFLKTNSSGATLFAVDNGGVMFNNEASVAVNSGNLMLQAGGDSTNGSFSVAAGSVVDFNGGLFSFEGNPSMLGAGTNRVSGGSVVFNNTTNSIAAGSTFEIASGVVSGTNTLAGAGAINWSGGTISATLALPSTLAFNITGANDKELGSYGFPAVINLFGPATWSGAGEILCGLGSVIQNNSTFTIQTDSSMKNYTGGGLPLPVLINNGILRKNTTSGTTSWLPDNGGVNLIQNGTMDIQSGVLSLQTAFTVNNGSVFSGAGETRIDSAAVSISGTTTLQGGTLEMANGVWQGTNTFTGAGAFIWSGGALNSTLLNLQSNISLNLAGGDIKVVGAYGAPTIINNAGAAFWTGPGIIYFSLGSVFNNSGTFTAQNDASFYNYTGGGTPLPVFANTGTFRKTTTTGIITTDPANGGVIFSNSGAIDLQSGSLALNGGYLSSGAPVLKLALGGGAAGGQFSQETFPDAATLGGTLQVSLINGFTPTNGQAFPIVTYGSETGQFSSTQLPVLPNNLSWTVTYDSSAVTLHVTGAAPTIITNMAYLSNGHFKFTVNGPGASSAIVQGSTNLINWQPLQTNAPFGGTLQFDDGQTNSARYYRVLIQP